MKVRVEKLDDVVEHIPVLLQRMKKEYLQRHYKILSWKDHFDFLGQIARKTGKLLKGNEPDYSTVAKKVLYDWQRGKIPWFVPPPFDDEKDKEEAKSQKHTNIEIKQLFNNIRLTEDFIFDKEDRKDKYAPEKTEELIRENEKQSDEKSEEIVDWDEVYKSIGKGMDDEEEEDGMLENESPKEEATSEQIQMEVENSEGDEDDSFQVGKIDYSDVEEEEDEKPITEENPEIERKPKLKEKEQRSRKRKRKEKKPEQSSRNESVGYIPAKILKRIMKSKKRKL